MEFKETNICIVGAGPAGLSAAIKLAQEGLAVTVVDRHNFPRDKVCGDALSVYAKACIKKLDADLFRNIEESKDCLKYEGLKIYGPSGAEINVHLNANNTGRYGFVSRRLHLDSILIEFASKNPLIKIITGTRINRIERHNNLLDIFSPHINYYIRSKILLVADGSESHVSKLLLTQLIEEDQESFALRQYFKGVVFQSASPEFYFVTGVLPGYVWIFPLPNGLANVGIYLQRKHIKDKKINLRKLFLEIIATNPTLKKRLENAVAEDDISGFNLKTGPLRKKISGHNFLLLGDAAGLVDPLTGEGIGNAIFSGITAAETVKECFVQNNFSASHLSKFDKKVKKELGKKLWLNGLLSIAFTSSLFIKTIEYLASLKALRIVFAGLYLLREKIKF